MARKPTYWQTEEERDPEEWRRNVTKRREREARAREEGEERAHADYLSKIEKAPLADWTTVEGQLVLRSGSSRFVGAPRTGKKNAATFDVIDLKKREWVTTLKKSEIYTWLWNAAISETEGEV